MKIPNSKAETIIWEGSTMRLNLSNIQVQQRVKAQIAAANTFFKKQRKTACKESQP